MIKEDTLFVQIIDLKVIKEGFYWLKESDRVEIVTGFPGASWQCM